MTKYDYQDIPYEGKIPLKVLIPVIAVIIVGAIAAIYLLSLPPSRDQVIENLYDEGETWVQSGEFTRAINTYSEIIDLAPNEEKAWHEKGKLLNRFERCDEAVAHYERYIANFPDSARAHEGYEIASNCS